MIKISATQQRIDKIPSEENTLDNQQQRVVKTLNVIQKFLPSLVLLQKTIKKYQSIDSECLCHMRKELQMKFTKPKIWWIVANSLVLIYIFIIFLNQATQKLDEKYGTWFLVTKVFGFMKIIDYTAVEIVNCVATYSNQSQEPSDEAEKSTNKALNSTQFIKNWQKVSFQVPQQVTQIQQLQILQENFNNLISIEKVQIKSFIILKNIVAKMYQNSDNFNKQTSQIANYLKNREPVSRKENLWTIFNIICQIVFAILLIIEVGRQYEEGFQYVLARIVGLISIVDYTMQNYNFYKSKLLPINIQVSQSIGNERESDQEDLLLSFQEINDKLQNFVFNIQRNHERERERTLKLKKVISQINKSIKEISAAIQACKKAIIVNHQNNEKDILKIKFKAKFNQSISGLQYFWIGVSIAVQGFINIVLLVLSAKKVDQEFGLSGYTAGIIGVIIFIDYGINKVA